ncbi:MAG TPA: cyanophycinase [Vicinamibacterales bacterium]|nr:cyanophycinase [Vicinamibacterales bacterium]
MRTVLFALALTVWAHAPLQDHSAGPLVIVGGGGTTPGIVSSTLTLAGGPEAIVAVLPQASAEPDAGDDSVKMWREAGAHEAVKVVLSDRKAAADAIARATLIWFPGGDQNRLVKAIDEAGLADLIRARHTAGVVIGGTSAGAAVMSKAMMTGDANLKSLTTGTTVIAEGLGLWPEAIVDQHFLTRQRDNRLLSAVLDHPGLVGVGIDESTAVVVRGSAFTVMGKSAVVVIDARHARVERAAPGQPVAARDVRLSILRAGMSYDLALPHD